MDYPSFVRWNVKGICSKMLVCYEKYYRGAAPDQRSRITQAACEATALDDLDRKLAYHTQEMKLLSAQCYASIMRSSCREFAMVALWDASCLALRRATRQAVARSGSRRKRPGNTSAH